MTFHLKYDYYLNRVLQWENNIFFSLLCRNWFSKWGMHI